MIKNWYLTGDTHGTNAHRVSSLLETTDGLIPEETALIILGDVGFNYYLKKKDWKNKHEAEKKGVYIYCVRGNHEARPQNVKQMELVYDENVQGLVWMEEEFPHIRYFKDWGEYCFNDLKVLVIGGAYSVDKWYRLQNDFTWFADEQLTKEEMNACTLTTHGKTYDLVLSHTCPLSFQPTDLFLWMVDQSSVDNTMEQWLEKVKDNFNWFVWAFGHYHQDRIELPCVEQFYFEIENVNTVMNRWKEFTTKEKLDWWLPISPRMKRIMEGE